MFETRHHLYLIVEYCRFGELFDELLREPKGYLSESLTANVMRQLADGVDAMHKKGFLHRDLKLENVLIASKRTKRVRTGSESSQGVSDCDSEHGMSDNECLPMSEMEGKRRHSEKRLDAMLKRRHSEYVTGVGMGRRMIGSPVMSESEVELTVKISDFGLSREMEEEKDGADDGRMATNCGTLYYVAPEILANEPYSAKVDTWSLGVILYVLLCGALPFFSENELEISAQITACTYELGDSEATTQEAIRWREVSEEAKHLVRALLTKDWRKRLSAEEILRHPFVTRTKLEVTDEVSEKKVSTETGGASDVEKRSPTTATAMLRAKWPAMGKMNKLSVLKGKVNKWNMPALHGKLKNITSRLHAPNAAAADNGLRSPSPSPSPGLVSEVDTEHSAAE